MKSPLARRLFLVAGALLCLANAGAGECGANGAQGCFNNNCGTSDLGYRPLDMGANGGSDGGAASDLGSVNGDSIVMTTPAPLASLVAINTNLVFQVGVGSSSPSAYEPNITIETWGVADMGSVKVAGAFSWKQPASGPAQLTFIPNGPLTDNTDYEVIVKAPSNPNIEVLHTGFSTGSRPRVTGVALIIGTGQATSLDVSFSEPMDFSKLNGRIIVVSGTTTLSTSISAAPNGDAIVQITNPSKIGGTLSLRVDGSAQAVAMGTLITTDWTTATEPSAGVFECKFSNVVVSQPSTQTWTPIVN